jgi:hypothetical protein
LRINGAFNPAARTQGIEFLHDADDHDDRVALGQSQCLIERNELELEHIRVTEIQHNTKMHYYHADGL